tara:strand:- start:1098 stop:1595 length:498 start_codon:yes stop_codon:yes gene_type:complete
MRKEIVFDSSTAILLAKIHLLNTVTQKLRVFFPEAVKEETIKKKDSFDSKLIIKLIDENKINVVKANQSKVNKLTKDFNIEKGEAEALELAREKKCISATDDGPSIKLCKILDIEFTTAIHFLIRFYEKGILNKKIAMEKLKMLEKYGRYDYDIIKDAKNRIGGK